MSLVVVGSVAYDGVETPHGKVERMLGGACTYIALSASYFNPVSIVAVVGEDFDPADREVLARRKIDLAGLETKPGKTFFWSGVYSEDMNDRTTLRTDLNVFADFQPSLPETCRSMPYLMMGNIQPELQRSVLRQMSKLKYAAGDTMNYWIRDFRSELLETIREWDCLMINDSEARMLTGEQNLRRAARVIAAMGPSTLVIKRGEYGALLFHDDREFIAPAYPLDKVVDPTGAGDSFAGGFMGYLAQQKLTPASGQTGWQTLCRAVVYGSVMGSYCCEDFGVQRLRNLTDGDILGRFTEFRRLTEF